MTQAFTLDPKLAADTSFIARLGLCRVLLMNDRRFPWIVLVPERAGLRELHDVAPADEAALFADIRRASRALAQVTRAHKMNVAALGNQVAQLHIHIIARFREDRAWPNPIWGTGPAEAYAETERAAFTARLSQALSGSDSR